MTDRSTFVVEDVTLELYGQNLIYGKLGAYKVIPASIGDDGVTGVVVNNDNLYWGTLLSDVADRDWISYDTLGYAVITTPDVPGISKESLLDTFFSLPRPNINIYESGCFFVPIDLGEYGGVQNVVFEIHDLNKLTTPQMLVNNRLSGHFKCDDNGGNVEFVNDSLDMYLWSVITDKLVSMNYCILTVPQQSSEPSEASTLHPTAFVV